MSEELEREKQAFKDFSLSFITDHRYKHYPLVSLRRDNRVGRKSGSRCLTVPEICELVLKDAFSGGEPINPGDHIYSRDGLTEYVVESDGSWRKVKGEVSGG